MTQLGAYRFNGSGGASRVFLPASVTRTSEDGGSLGRDSQLGRAAGAEPREVAVPERVRVLRQGLRRGELPGGHVLRGSASLALAVVIAALGGFVFWLVGARIASAASVGRASALFTSALFLNYATSMGLPVAAARYAPDRSSGAGILFSWGLVVTTLSSAIGTVLFLLVLPGRLATPLWYWGHPAGFVMFFAVVTGMSFATLVDVRLMALRRWGWVSGRAALVGLVRLPFLAMHPVGNDATWLFLLVGGSQALSGFAGVLAVQRAGGQPSRLWPLPEQTRAAIRYAWVNYASQLAVQAPFFVLPILVLAHVSAASNASFYVAWSIMAVVFVFDQVVGQVVLVEGGKEGARLRHQAREALALAVIVTALLAAVSAIGSGLVVDVYGHAYTNAARILPALVVANVPWSVTCICLAVARVREDAATTVATTVVFAVAILGPAAILTAHGGVDGAVRAWLIGNLVGGAVAAVLALRAGTRDAPRMPRIPVAGHGAA